MWSRIAVLLAAILAVLVLTGAGQVRPAGGGPEDPGAARAVAVLTGIQDGDVNDAVPPDFAEVMGYRPEARQGPDGSRQLVKPGGGCSTPFGATLYDFAPACQTHDYGYDLLRYATARGGELGPWARVAIDERLGEDLRQQCVASGSGAACRTAAALGEAAVKVNSWRQGQGNPGVESLVPYIFSGALIGAAVVVPPLVTRITRPAGRRRLSAAN